MSAVGLVILGATGSIGQSAARVARDLPDRVRIVGISGYRNMEGLAALAAEFRPEAVAVPEGADAPALPEETRLLRGPSGLEELACLGSADAVLVAIVGTGGLVPALAALRAGKRLAVASKEILVMAGEAVMGAAAESGAWVLPVDSEHNAIFQCLAERPDAGDGAGPWLRRDFRRLILTASGGPFREWEASRLERVTPAEALKHPTWSMGAKITVDSATLFNKGLEMIEARHLFGAQMEQVDVVVHPQSVVHSMVEFADGSVLAQLSVTDMAFPIQYALTWPERVANTLPPLDFARLGKLEFEAPRRDVFPALDLARRAGEEGGTLPAVLNAANEVAVAAFLEGRCAFPAIWRTVEVVMAEHEKGGLGPAELEAIFEADAWARRRAGERVGEGE